MTSTISSVGNPSSASTHSSRTHHHRHMKFGEIPECYEKEKIIGPPEGHNKYPRFIFIKLTDTCDSPAYSVNGIYSEAKLMNQLVSHLRQLRHDHLVGKQLEFFLVDSRPEMERTAKLNMGPISIRKAYQEVEGTEPPQYLQIYYNHSDEHKGNEAFPFMNMANPAGAGFPIPSGFPSTINSSNPTYPGTGATFGTSYPGATLGTPYSGTVPGTPYFGTGPGTPYSGTGAVTPYSGAGARTPYSGTTSTAPYTNPGMSNTLNTPGTSYTATNPGIPYNMTSPGTTYSQLSSKTISSTPTPTIQKKKK